MVGLMIVAEKFRPISTDLGSDCIEVFDLSIAEITNEFGQTFSVPRPKNSLWRLS